MRPGDKALSFDMTSREAYTYSLGVCEGMIRASGSTNLDSVLVEALELYRRALAKQLATIKPPSPAPPVEASVENSHENSSVLAEKKGEGA